MNLFSYECWPNIFVLNVKIFSTLPVIFELVFFFFFVCCHYYCCFFSRFLFSMIVVVVVFVFKHKCRDKTNHIPYFNSVEFVGTIFCFSFFCCCCAVINGFRFCLFLFFFFFSSVCFFLLFTGSSLIRIGQPVLFQSQML